MCVCVCVCVCVCMCVCVFVCVCVLVCGCVGVCVGINSEYGDDVMIAFVRQRGGGGISCSFASQVYDLKDKQFDH